MSVGAARHRDPGPAVLTAALTGPIATKADNSALPVTPEEIARDAVAARAAGAAVVHVHARDDQGRPTADLDIARRILDLIRDRTDVLVQLSTGVGLEVPFEERERLVEARPAMATLNVCSMTFGRGEFRNPPDGVRRLAARMQELGVRPELEIYDTGHVSTALRLVDEGLLAEPLQFSAVLGVAGGAPATAASLVRIVEMLPQNAIWQAIGIGRANLSVTAIGLAMGGNARTGMEDTLSMKRGVPATGNEQLVARLAAITRALGREPATIAETADALRLNTASDPNSDGPGDRGHHLQSRPGRPNPRPID
jgi:3-keto-5-aminohexanoate cleavage enzyme